MSAAPQLPDFIGDGTPAVGSQWTPDGRDVCEVVATMPPCRYAPAGCVVRWLVTHADRRALYADVRDFYAAMHPWRADLQGELFEDVAR